MRRVHVGAINWLNSTIDDQAEPGDEEEDGFDPDRLAVCAYWRCRELFERRSANHRYCRKACRSRQNKWQRAQARKTRR